MHYIIGLFVFFIGFNAGPATASDAAAERLIGAATIIMRAHVECPDGAGIPETALDTAEKVYDGYWKKNADVTTFIGLAAQQKFKESKTSYCEYYRLQSLVQKMHKGTMMLEQDMTWGEAVRVAYDECDNSAGWNAENLDTVERYLTSITEIDETHRFEDLQDVYEKKAKSEYKKNPKTFCAKMQFKP